MKYGKRSLLAGLALMSSTMLTVAADKPGAAPVKPLDPSWFVKIGPAGVFFDSGAKLYTAAGQVDGATARATDNLAALFEIGYFVTDNVAISLTGGVPPTTTLNGRGTAAGFGTLGKVTYGPATLTANYHFKDFGALQPYAGLGVGYAFIFGQKDGAVQQLSVKGAPAFVMQAGTDWQIDKNWGVFLDVKKLLLSVDASGNIPGPGAVTARVKLDPTIVFTGISYRF